MNEKILHQKLLTAMTRRLEGGTSAEKRTGEEQTREKSVELADEWMARLFAAYQEQKITDNVRIWEIGRIFVPISLAPFLLALDPTKSLGLRELAGCAGVSCGLYVFWLFFAERHRMFQEASERAQIEIVQQMAEVSGDSVNSLSNLVVPTRETKAPWPSVRLIRWFGLVVLLVAWVSVLLSGPPTVQPPQPPKPNSEHTQTAPPGPPPGAPTKQQSDSRGQPSKSSPHEVR